MKVFGHPYSLLNPGEISRIHQSALRILEEMGMEIHNNFLLTILAESGLQVDQQKNRVRFPATWVENWIADCEKSDWESVSPSVDASAGIYFSRFHDPISREMTSWTEERLATYIQLANLLPNIGQAVLLGNRLEGEQFLEPLYERYYAWKWGAREGGSILQDELCPYLTELYEIAADHRNLQSDEIFHATVYLIPALRLGKHEAYQVAYFLERGFRVNIGGSMLSMGANAPVTVAGSVTLNLAEQLALQILAWSFFGDQNFHLSCSIAPLDMRTLVRPFGRPESTVTNLVMAQLARFYGASFFGHAGLCDAKVPSVEAGVQKASSALPVLMAGGNLWMDAGLLAIDEVCSPIQLVLDNEFLSALKYLCQDFKFDEESIGLDIILETGPAGIYAGHEHTVRHFRKELWQPTVWSREMFNVWEASGGMIDADKAAEIASSVRPERVKINETFEIDLLEVIDDARRLLSIQ